MRWFVFLLLLLGAVFSLSFLFPAPAGQAGLLWPFAQDSRSILGTESPLLQSVWSLLAGLSAICFLLAAAAFFTRSISPSLWLAAALLAAAASLLLHLGYLSARTIAPVLVDAALLAGILIGRWRLDSLRLPAERAVTAHIHPLMNIPVPWIFILTFLAGLGLQLILPVPVLSTQIMLVSHILGALFTFAGLVLAVAGLGLFRRAGTTTVPFQRVTQLVTSGPYRFTRNPMYLGLTLLYLGEAGLFVAPWAVILLVLPLYYVNRLIIPLEEGQLYDAFGDQYRLYCSRVRRWL
jgi:protein-S-isoprenylcysteine O-methyltransferase Ste14